MSTANLVPETRDLTGDDAYKTLRRTGRRRLLVDAFKRLRVADGFSHARSLAFLTVLVVVQGTIALVGLASVLGNRNVQRRSDLARSREPLRDPPVTCSPQRRPKPRRPATATRWWPSLSVSPDACSPRRPHSVSSNARSIASTASRPIGPPLTSTGSRSCSRSLVGTLPRRRVRVRGVRRHPHGLARRRARSTPHGSSSAGRWRSSSWPRGPGAAVQVVTAPAPAAVVVARIRGRGRHDTLGVEHPSARSLLPVELHVR